MKLLLLLFFCVNLQAQPIEFIVAAAVGGPDDTITRKLISKIEEQSNLKFIIVNKPGAAHTIGYNYMNQSVQPSLMISNNNIVNNDLYKTSKPVFKLGTFSNIVFVSKASPIKDIKDLIELSQKRQINFAHGGVGTASHKAMARLCEKTLNCLPVPYKGASQAMLDLLNGTVDTFAVVSYGANAFLQNTSYKSIGKISNEDNWVILFGKNLSNKDVETMQTILNQTNNDFFTEMGFL